MNFTHRIPTHYATAKHTTTSVYSTTFMSNLWHVTIISRSMALQISQLRANVWSSGHIHSTKIPCWLLLKRWNLCLYIWPSDTAGTKPTKQENRMTRTAIGNAVCIFSNARRTTVKSYLFLPIDTWWSWSQHATRTLISYYVSSQTFKILLLASSRLQSPDSGVSLFACSANQNKHLGLITVELPTVANIIFFYDVV